MIINDGDDDDVDDDDNNNNNKQHTNRHDSVLNYTLTYARKWGYN
jgi:hypothetical protein